MAARVISIALWVWRGKGPGTLLPVALALLLVAPAVSEASDLSKTYEWKPVRVGAGGWVTGLVSHPLDANVRYCRTDVAGAYRWDAAKHEWKGAGHTALSQVADAEGFGSRLDIEC